MSDAPPVILWFRQDLRLSDNPALAAAANTGQPILPVYVLDDENAGEWAMGAASRWWLHQSLAALNKDLKGRLLLCAGKADTIIPRLAARVDADGVFWNRCYEPWRIARDTVIKKQLIDSGCEAQSCDGSLLFEPHDITKTDGTPYKVFTAFYRKGCLANGPPPRELVDKPGRMKLYRGEDGAALDDLGLLPDIPWHEEMARTWSPGENGAHARLQTFLEEKIDHYKTGRDRPDQDYVSRLSPHLHFGEISPHEIWHGVQTLKGDAAIAADADHFLSEIGWREFSNHLLYYWPQMTRENLQRKFDRFPWRDDPAALKRWQHGRTGYPIVDAGMRQLWRTGYMHNRVRMVVGSFLVKNLMLHWHHGADWFWDTLVDADLANNTAGWQWISGCGADAAPFFRIFNPVTQGRKFDPEGVYVREYVPELAALPDKFIHSPWEAPSSVLAEAGVGLDRDYPSPMVDLKASRERALAAFRQLKQQ